MSLKKWGDKQNMKFVNAYKSKECLWNQFSPLYNNKLAREAAVLEISAEMNLDNFGVHEVKAKIKSLRGTYHLELEKQKKSEQSGAAEVYVPKVKWFNVMKEIVSKGTIKKEPANNHQDLTLANYVDSVLDSGGDSIDDTTPSPAIGYMQNGHSEPHRQPKKKKFKQSLKMQQMPSTPQHLNYSYSEPNEFDVFGNLVAVHLKKLSPQQALEAETRIFTILNEYRADNLNSQSPVIASYSDRPSSPAPSDSSVYSII
ncbi:Alcohol dehydrogenase transcription factor Myb/SANT-like [Nesidiocoris tenuis]|uniref:Alcohol dehydrogenase transcription factor Myb/SANT-like n=1 Tax=Nesidiocoris tenuis TaxID=355587 RepID=A0ABN7AWT9_9HEMI|nr:Alcohol dehydrogenase transcription factor Myb/SANT-like [Nesidiocoris tenuis]